MIVGAGFQPARIGVERLGGSGTRPYRFIGVHRRPPVVVLFMSCETSVAELPLIDRRFPTTDFAGRYTERIEWNAASCMGYGVTGVRRRSIDESSRFS